MLGESERLPKLLCHKIHDLIRESTDDFVNERPMHGHEAFHSSTVFQSSGEVSASTFCMS